jgi:hypothetical protein
MLLQQAELSGSFLLVKTVAAMTFVTCGIWFLQAALHDELRVRVLLP